MHGRFDLRLTISTRRKEEIQDFKFRALSLLLSPFKNQRKSHFMASTRGDLPHSETEAEQEPPDKTAKTNDKDDTEKKKQRVVLNPADSDLDFIIEDDLIGSARHDQGFAYCWSGARANVGITVGKYCFGCKILSTQPVEMEGTPPHQQHVCRLGISRGGVEVGRLGETRNSFGFEGTGKFSNAENFSVYGEKFGVGETIVCAVDLASKPLASIGFVKNGKWLGTAKQFNTDPEDLGVVDSPLRKLPWKSAVFPHVLLKNVVVQLQFSFEDGLVPENGYKPWASAFEDGNVIKGPDFHSETDCEVMMMVGLHAAGKTTWAKKWVREHPEKRYIFLGTNQALKKMKVSVFLLRTYGEIPDPWTGLVSQISDFLISRAAKIRRNYVFDQLNNCKSRRNRKLGLFERFRKIAVVVFPKPEELNLRIAKKLEGTGTGLPADEVNNMLAKYTLPLTKNMPGSDELFDEVKFVELDRGETQRYLDEMKRSVESASVYLTYPGVQALPEGYQLYQVSQQPVPYWPYLYNGSSSIPGENVYSTYPGVQAYSEWYQVYQVQQQPAPYGPSLHNGSSSIPRENVYSTDPGVQAYSEGYQVYQVPQQPAPYWPYLDNGSSSIPRENAGSFGSFHPIPGDGSNHYQSPYNGVDNIHGRPASSCSSSMVEPSPVRSDYHVGQCSSGGGLEHASFQAPRPPIFEQSPPPSTDGSYSNFFCRDC
ncbi:PREDICTED: heterogeneous nuclear ribonucleoprotein U-like protein 1 [Theobroma cacao]|uniref:Heterogeneous nuclear ribonucleoprotein U-like protein 1 n=1 Tax=Theobroma cacao TaxID=3641 RepID=A0AB32WHF7_THECC|nr:PREDICTED: heterogeneous nuclear ribonucleoprotein U-like protein 1 [Theobroma cacao]